MTKMTNQILVNLKDTLITMNQIYHMMFHLLILTRAMKTIIMVIMLVNNLSLMRIKQMVMVMVMDMEMGMGMGTEMGMGMVILKLQFMMMLH